LESLGVGKGSKLLDLGCGNGRIAIHLAKLGYNVVGVNISPVFIEDAWRKAKAYGVEANVEFVTVDARKLLKRHKGYEPFDATLNVWTTILGYYTRNDVKILFILNTANKDVVTCRHTFMPRPSLFEDYGDFVVVEHPEYDPVTDTLSNKWVFYKKQGKDLIYIDEFSFNLHIYSLHELVEVAREAGWKYVNAYSNLEMLTPFKPSLSSLNVVFQKP